MISFAGKHYNFFFLYCKPWKVAILSLLKQKFTVLLYYHQLTTSKCQVDVVHIGFHKAFDSVLHNKLLLKLWNISNVWKWFKSYLSGRVKCVSINNCLSNCLPVLSGVRRGSILGPLLFWYTKMTFPLLFIHPTCLPLLMTQSVLWK